MRHKILQLLKPHLDEIFQRFYQQMLAHSDFQNYFSSEQQIIELIAKQKAYFALSFTKSDEEVKAEYVRLGELHYDLKLPFVDFAAGLDMLQEQTIHLVYHEQVHEKMLDETFNFYRLIRAYTAKGYLNKVLAQDALDIDIYLERVSQLQESQNKIAVERLLWLKNFIYAIQKESRLLAPSFKLEDTVLEHIQSTVKHNLSFMNYINDMVERIRIDASNVFFFLEKQNYSDVLPLYRELLSIYKLSLMLTNMITVANDDAIIRDLVKDPLTGLLNRRSMQNLIEKEFVIADAQDYALSFIFVDIDHFKRFNDQYGHAVGDKVLAQVAQLIKANIRATDYAFRYGGEEMLIVLKAAPLQVAITQAEAIRKAIEQHPVELSDQTISITASLGVYTCSKPFNITVQEAIAYADEMMYRAKGLGRNQVAYKK